MMVTKLLKVGAVKCNEKCALKFDLTFTETIKQLQCESVYNKFEAEKKSCKEQLEVGKIEIDFIQLSSLKFFIPSNTYITVNAYFVLFPYSCPRRLLPVRF